MKLLKENLLAAVFLITLTIVDGFFLFPGPIIYPKEKEEAKTTPKPEPKPKPEKPKHSYPKHEYGQPIFIPVPFGYGGEYEHKTTTTPKPKHTYPPQQGGYYAFIPYGSGGQQGYESEETTETETEAPTTTPAPPSEKHKPSNSHHIPFVIPPPFPFLPNLPSLFNKLQPIYSYTPPPGYKEDIIEEEGYDEARVMPNKPPKNAVTPPNFITQVTEHAYRPQFESDDSPGFMGGAYPDQYRPPGLQSPKNTGSIINRRPNPPIYTSPPRKPPQLKPEVEDEPKRPPTRVYSSPPRKPTRNYGAPPRKQPTPEIPSFDSNEVADTPPPRVYTSPPRKPQSYNNRPQQPESETTLTRNYLPPPRTPSNKYGPPAPVNLPSLPKVPETTVLPQTTTSPAKFYLPPLRAPASPSSAFDPNQPSRVYDVPPAPPSQYKLVKNPTNNKTNAIYLPPQQLEPHQTSRFYDVPPPSQQFSSVDIYPPKSSDSPYNFYFPPQRPSVQNYKTQYMSNPFVTTDNEIVPMMQPPTLPAVYETPAHMQVRNMPSYLKPPAIPASFEMPGFTFERMVQSNQNYVPASRDGEHNNLIEMQLANSANIMLLEKKTNDMNVKSNKSFNNIPSFVTETMNTKNNADITKVPLISDFEIPSESLTSSQSKPIVPKKLIPKSSSAQLSISPSTMPPPELPTKYDMPTHKDERKFYSSDETTVAPTDAPYKITIFPFRRPAVNKDSKNARNLQAQVINSGIYSPPEPEMNQSANNPDSQTSHEITDENIDDAVTEESVFPSLPIRQEGASNVRWNLRDTIANPLLEPAGTPSNSQIKLIKEKIEVNKNAKHNKT